jgi:CheY-like chemotaxis protein
MHHAPSTYTSADEVVSDSRWPTLLCVDDDPQITEVLRMRLLPYQLDVRCAHHGMQGLAMAALEQPDVIVTDLRMPQGSGEYVVERLRTDERTASIPIIVLTGYCPPTVRQRLHFLGVAAVFIKPVPFQVLHSAIAECIPLRERVDPQLDDETVTHP